ncbi:bifunctional proline dehydrogenase/L-glutamate gamma-semialdehyde dehydrogenase [Corynebacterium sp. 153RC1]|uniref:bifunctional proline dehydrogenase/L-glutamate gamma-semialdehyde dehydrogenase n=1 Tax=unclassified Corynebacterium TaxID=2624378 RepID=UPI00211CEA12|nr:MULTISPECIES: bifunctional proline dehydrogenase/L-glutamate gamma-semialdehyde dehydrogenase [unclassified Corynebacterium]MCQ9371444.1 bifunctional proline dehydrogenase/L-glutamate gamma-semialdehyde dehydrogenase [Corynebacterium sp. 35RC1]MCQ9353377.1 bifunctional proline dehydrogenase/L-glutamate gamma-semialdehyde dehydrogenase [Corynebacterium sp. 209RC1]MCQ9355606.1 bifunctional proline dehydrogenase/L-glutamate gamma-semialdehyde dehydrogenase [Corynebacterium sp. 1222RC1]MCQ935732
MNAHTPQNPQSPQSQKGQTNSASHTPLANSADVEEVLSAAIARAHDWLAETDNAASKKEAKNTEQLAALVRDKDGIAFTMGFVDKVARPEDNKVAAKELANLASPFSKHSVLPDFIGLVDKGLVTAGSLAAPVLPGVVMPLARKRMRQMVGHLVLDAEGKALNAKLDEAKREGFQLNLNLLGEAVLGDDEAKSRLERTRQLLQNPRVTYVSIKASSVCAQLNPWDIEGNTERLKDRLRPLYREAKKRSPHAFINMDMEEYKDLTLTIRLFKELMIEDEFLDLQVGIVLQAYLPDTFDALVELAEFAKERRAAGGAPIKIRLVKGANLSMERVDAEMHDWALATYSNKADVDANYYRLMDYILQPEHADNVRIGVASHNLYTVALAHELATRRGVAHQLDIEMLQGMAPAQSRAVQKVVGGLILYTPVVHAEDFDVAVSYLVRRLEENGEKQNFLHALFAPEVEGPDHLTPLESQEQAFRTAVENRWTTVAGPNRKQDRNNESGIQSHATTSHFAGEPDTDPSLQQNRDWALKVLAADPGERVSPEITDPAQIDEFVAKARELGTEWGATTGEERAQALEAIANKLADHRGELMNVMVHESGKTVAEADPELSEGIDFAMYYAQSARELDKARSKFTPYKVVLITPPWNFPMAIPVGGVFSALAAGAAVIIKPAPQVVRVAEVAVDVIRAGLKEAGHNPDLVQLVNADEAEAGKRLVSHEDVDSVILTGASDTARLFRSWKPKMVLNAETSGKNAIIVTPAADPDLAVADVYKSAFGHAGQKCSAASLVILVGSVGTSERFINQLLDAVRTLKVGPGSDISTTMNGIIEAPGEKLKRGLTQLEPGEKWLIQPRQLNDEGTLWSPGVRDGVKPGSWYHTNECFGPVLGIMRADTLEEAIEWQNSTGYGLTGGIHTLDPEEIAYWREHVEVGNAYINRGITGAIVERQSFGGWKDSSIGSGAKAGGPNYVAQQGTWAEGNLDSVPTASLRPEITRALREVELSDADSAWLRKAAYLDAAAWNEEFGIEHDRTGLVSESNVFRYRPLLQALEVRVGAGYKERDLLRLKLAAALTGSPVRFSAAEEIAAVAGVEAIGDADFAAHVEKQTSTRVRTIGEVDEALYAAAAQSGSVILDQEVLADGRRELLPFLLEQTVTATRHRFGVISPELAPENV